MSRIDLHQPFARGMTLAELLISLVIVAFMMVGIYATDHAVRSMNVKVSDDVTLTVQARSISEYIRRDAMKMTGELGNVGFDNTSYANTFCIRQDNEADPKPADYTNDIWVCYTLRDSNKDLYRCAGLPGDNHASCDSGGTFIGRIMASNPLPSFVNNHFFQKLHILHDPTINQNSTTNPGVDIDISVYPAGHSNF